VLGRLGKRIRRLRRIFSRSEWAAENLRLRKHGELHADPHTPGVIVIQIDGLGYDRLLQAIDKRKLPFLQRLIQRDNFILRKFYSGLPSTTPAVQAELFYGIKSAVPSFEYYDRETQKKRAMFTPEAADAVANRLDSTARGLLAGGSSYSNIFAGGAREAPFCIQSMKLQSLFAGIQPGKIAWFVLVNVEKIIRVTALFLLEMALTLREFFRALFRRKNPLMEFRFNYSRIGTCIVLRELIRMHVKIDIARGLPIIHANFTGYDEHAHRRNPHSALALRTLKSIDAAIKDIVTTAIRSDRRDYQVFIYSDHGQEPVTPFTSENKETLHEAVARVFSFGTLAGFSLAEEKWTLEHLHLRRYPLFFWKKTSRQGMQESAESADDPAMIHITAMGPLGHIYLPCKIDSTDMYEYGRQLVINGGIPLVFFVDRNRVICVTATGTGQLADKAAGAFGKDHPYLARLCEDMEVLCRHRDSGDFIISAYRPSGSSLSFVNENGAHGGPGARETGAFVILPDTVSSVSQSYLRPDDLRHQIIGIFKEGVVTPRPVPKAQLQTPQPLTVMTYNIHSCLGMDGKLFPARIARIIGRSSPDVVALQEVDRNMARTGSSDQTQIIAEQLGMHGCYFPLWQSDGGEYGLAVLSRFPVVDKRFLFLPDLGPDTYTEQRGILWTTLQTENGRLHLLNTHLSLVRRERLRQIRHIADTIIAGGVPSSEPLILCGDFNAGIKSPTYDILTTRLRDCQNIHAQIPPEPTFFSSYPLLRLDHIFHSDHLVPTSIGVINDWECRLASDHLPLQATLRHEKRRL